MHNLRYIAFDASTALIVVGIGVSVLGALHVFEILAARHVRERTQRAIDRARSRMAESDRVSK
jgi:hypothetical protein